MVSTFSHVYIESGFQVQLTGCLEWRVMALLQYLQSRDGLPDPRGPISSTIPAKGLLKQSGRYKKPPASAAKGLNVGLTSDTAPVFMLR